MKIAKNPRINSMEMEAIVWSWRWGHSKPHVARN
jgi:hypothetical protein